MWYENLHYQRIFRAWSVHPMSISWATLGLWIPPPLSSLCIPMATWALSDTTGCSYALQTKWHTCALNFFWFFWGVNFDIYTPLCRWFLAGKAKLSNTCPWTFPYQSDWPAGNPSLFQYTPNITNESPSAKNACSLWIYDISSLPYQQDNTHLCLVASGDSKPDPGFSVAAIFLALLQLTVQLFQSIFSAAPSEGNEHHFSSLGALMTKHQY